MQYFILGIALLVALLFLGRWFVDADPHKVARALKWGGLAVAAGVVLLLLIGGRVGLLMVALPLLLWLYRTFQRVKAAQGPSAGQASEVRTRFLQMTLDHDSGTLDGRILDGRHEGRLLSELELPELLELLHDYRIADSQSAAVLEAYLDRTQGADWREEGAAEAGAGAGAESGGSAGGRQRAAQQPASGAMTRAEALEILGLEEGAGPEAIREAHRRLMQKLHPDHGGSNYLAAKLNEAKELLLGH
ncbi:MAG: DnaJ domain-containing protein [Kiloniellaceae bacterium]